MTDGALILVVDDNEMNRDVLARRLQRQKYAVEVAENGEQALNMLQARPYDLILLDIQMPVLNGYDVLERVKADDTLRDIPVIMITAVDDLDSVVKCIELGAEDYLFKPFNPVLLRARVGASLERHRRRSSRPELKPVLTDLTATLERLQAGNLDADQMTLVNQLMEDTRRIAQLLNIEE